MGILIIIKMKYILVITIILFSITNISSIKVDPAMNMLFTPPRKIMTTYPPFVSRTFTKSEFSVFYRQHQMTLSEIQEIFNYADQNRDGKISNEEWSEFHRIFIMDFETNDVDHDYRLSNEEFKNTIRGTDSLLKIA